MLNYFMPDYSYFNVLFGYSVNVKIIIITNITLKTNTFIKFNNLSIFVNLYCIIVKFD